jgi:hypothetical protein
MTIYTDIKCWEIKKCERQKGGMKLYQLYECIASKYEMGHSCWAIAGPLCSGKIEGTFAQKVNFCTSCKVYHLYNHSRGKPGRLVQTMYPEEDAKYQDIMLKLSRVNSLAIYI